MATSSMSLPTADIPSSDPSWEGDRMFNIYIYDYCNKRGFRKTARELLAEADIPADSAPPINAKQGLLFEYVPSHFPPFPLSISPQDGGASFGFLFTAKSNGTGTEDAMVYTQVRPRSPPTSTVHQPPFQNQMQQVNLRQGSRPLSHQIPPVGRMINGNTAQMPFPIVGAGPQPNGIPIPSSTSTSVGPNPPQQNFTALLPSQRPTAPQHRPQNGVHPYQSPTIAHSPQNPGANSAPNPPNPMNQLGPSPHMAHMVRGGMLPPNANLASVPPTQTPPFSQLARSPSRPGSPGQMMQPSPSLMDRQTPHPHESNLNGELGRLPANVVNAIRQELGIHDKEPQSLTYEEKNRIVNLARQRSSVRKPGPGGPQGPAGPSNIVPGMQLAGQRSGQPQPQQGPPQQQPPQQLQQSQQQSQPTRVVKRNSTSPEGEVHFPWPIINNESSPPDRKRVRRSSVSMDQAPGSIVGYPHQPHQPPPQQMMNGGMMRPGPGPISAGMNNFPAHGPPGMTNPGIPMPMGAAQMPGNAMSPGMGRAPNMMGQIQYHQGVHAVTKGLAMASLPGGGAGTPTPGDPPFNPGPGQPFPGPQNNRLVQNKPMGMMPPPSPAGGPPKEQPKDVKPGLNGAEGSPRNQQLSNPVTGGQGPPNPGGGQQVNTAPPTPSATGSSITAPSPSAVVNGTPTLNPATQPTTSLPEVPANFLTTEFMQSVASTLDDFDTQALFRPEDTGINFEQDFREWFNPDDLDMK
ncbi:hypothetical protein JVU11DRAFT_6696 [Chiua virens]|nr:hypothetical protein JVU11DRAFT_6696 [Chiua virens]